MLIMLQPVIFHSLGPEWQLEFIEQLLRILRDSLLKLHLGLRQVHQKYVLDNWLHL